MRGSDVRSSQNDVADRERFERVFHHEYGAVLAYAARRADLELAKDAAAQTFLVAWRRRDELPDPARAWLLGVTRRTLADLRRSGRRQEVLRSRLSAAERAEDSANDSFEGSGDREGVALALAQLPEADAEILRLIYWDDLSCQQASEVLGCSITAAKVRLLRARRRFQRTIEPLGALEPNADVEPRRPHDSPKHAPTYPTEETS